MERALAEINKVKENLQGPADAVHQSVSTTAQELLNHVKTLAENINTQIQHGAAH